ncbi:MAG: hypothetical protein K8R49_02875 [Candidatus Cloacimonetes bacterium]|nr:hypothetical protein [Candidatus Cloacimonadota bacterium]
MFSKKKSIRLILLVVFLFLITLVLYAQDDYKVWKKQQQNSLREYKSAQDKAFVEFLEKNWKSFEAFKGEVHDDIPKPDTVPEVEQSGEKDFPETNIVKEIEVPKAVIMAEDQEVKESLVYAEPGSSPKIDVNFWGLPLEYNYTNKLEVALEPLNEKAVANFWYVTSNTDHEKFLQQVQDSREKMNLNDWGFCLLLNEIGKTITNDSKNLTNLFLWFMLTKSGYESKVGFSENDVYLLLPCKNVIYGVSYIMIDDKRFYAVAFDKTEKLSISINTYDGKYPNADDLIDLGVNKSPNIKKTIVEKELKFRYENVVYSIPVKYDQNAANFFRNYPQTNMDVYFKAPLSPEATRSLFTGFKPILEGKPETEAANILLRFVQTAFEYKTDGDQFGKEKCFFSDETLFYPYSDCEDRSIIFSYLVRNLLKLDVIGLDYPGHISTAVKFHGELEGDFVVFGEKKYTICDPTYINANLGMAMPKFKEIEPKVIEISEQ